MTENTDFLTTQLITYLGNKRLLLGNIESEVKKIKKTLNKEKLICADLFSGSGVVARMLKQHSEKIIVNDLELYSTVINSCYLSNKSEYPHKLCEKYLAEIKQRAEDKKLPGLITLHYAPKDELNITKSDRVFYTRENAILIDTYRQLIDDIVPLELQKFFLAPLITEASVHVNTSGVFKGFYKDKHTGIGCYGGSARNALTRICGRISLNAPVLSNFESAVDVYKEDAVELAKDLKNIDIAYLDPPYNQHPYGSNYFMLNVILKNKIDAPISQVSGITQNWNRSVFNKKQLALNALEKIIESLDAKYLIISYNSEGFIGFDEMLSMLKKYGVPKSIEVKYNTFRGSRNLANRNIYVSEYLFVLKK